MGMIDLVEQKSDVTCNGNDDRYVIKILWHYVIILYNVTLYCF